MRFIVSTKTWNIHNHIQKYRELCFIQVGRKCAKNAKKSKTIKRVFSIEKKNVEVNDRVQWTCIMHMCKRKKREWFLLLNEAFPSGLFVVVVFIHFVSEISSVYQQFNQPES